MKAPRLAFWHSRTVDTLACSCEGSSSVSVLLRLVVASACRRQGGPSGHCGMSDENVQHGFSQIQEGKMRTEAGAVELCFTSHVQLSDMWLALAWATWQWLYRAANKPPKQELHVYVWKGRTWLVSVWTWFVPQQEDSCKFHLNHLGVWRKVWCVNISSK